MSCDGWGVGDRCRCLFSFNVERAPIGPFVPERLFVGDEGVIQAIYNQHPHSHVVVLTWDRLGMPIAIPNHQLRYLQIMP
jgi:hypothetical protein